MRKQDLVEKLEDSLGSLDIVSRRLTAVSMVNDTEELVAKEKKAAFQATMNRVDKSVNDSSLTFDNDDSFGAGCNYGIMQQLRELKNTLAKLQY